MKKTDKLFQKHKSCLSSRYKKLFYSDSVGLYLLKAFNPAVAQKVSQYLSIIEVNPPDGLPGDVIKAIVGVRLMDWEGK